MKPTLATITSPLTPLKTRFLGQQICTSYSVDERSNFTYHSAPRTYCMTTNTAMSQRNDILHTCILWILKCDTETKGCETSHKYTKYTAFLKCKILWTFHKTVQEDCLTLEVGIDRLSRNVGNYQSTLRNIPEERNSNTVAEAWKYAWVTICCMTFVTTQKTTL